MNLTQEQREVLAGFSYELKVGINKGDQIEVYTLPGDYVEQLADAKRVEDVMALSFGDPEMVIIPPVEKSDAYDSFIDASSLETLKLSQKQFCKFVRGDLDHQISGFPVDID